VARGLTVAAKGAIGVSLLAACGGSPVLDSEKLEAAVAESLVPEAPETVTGVDCPDLILEGPIDVGCTALIGDVPIEVAVAISADDTAAISTEATIVAVAEMEADAAERLSRDLGSETSVSCPAPRVIVSLPGTILECDAIDPSGGAHEVTLTIRSEQGDWELTLG
jgi:hypothetical protein